MKTTTAPAAIVPAEFIGWDRFDWLESYEDATYERSVIWATDDNCRLAECDLKALFRDHFADYWEYRAHCTELAYSLEHVEHYCHAGQALTWLGY